VVTFPSKERHCLPSIGQYQIILLGEQLAQGCYSTAWRPELELATTQSPVRCLSH